MVCGICKKQPAVPPPCTPSTPCDATRRNVWPCNVTFPSRGNPSSSEPVSKSARSGQTPTPPTLHVRVSDRPSVCMYLTRTLLFLQILVIESISLNLIWCLTAGRQSPCRRGAQRSYDGCPIARDIKHFYLCLHLVLAVDYISPKSNIYYVQL